MATVGVKGLNSQNWQTDGSHRQSVREFQRDETVYLSTIMMSGFSWMWIGQSGCCRRRHRLKNINDDLFRSLDFTAAERTAATVWFLRAQPRQNMTTQLPTLLRRWILNVLITITITITAFLFQRLSIAVQRFNAVLIQVTFDLSDGQPEL